MFNRELPFLIRACVHHPLRCENLSRADLGCRCRRGDIAQWNLKRARFAGRRIINTSTQKHVALRYIDLLVHWRASLFEGGVEPRF